MTPAGDWPAPANRFVEGGPGSPEPRGFTFVELLIAAAMMSMLFVGLGAHLRGGLIVWQQVTLRGEAVQRQRAVFDRLDRDLATTFVYDDREETYGEEFGRLPAPQFGEDVLVLFSAERIPGGLSAVRIVTYRCEEREGRAGLWRTSQSIGEARAKLEPASELLLRGCSALSLQYAQRRAASEGKLEWGPLAERETPVLPRLIRVSLELSGGGRMERVCAVPVGVLPAAAP